MIPDALTGYAAEIRFLGDLLDVRTQVESLITYDKEAMNYVNNTRLNAKTGALFAGVD